MGVVNLDEWIAAVDRYQHEFVPGQLIRIQRSLVFMALGAAVQLAPGRGYAKIPGVTLLTPVDTGRARSSWNVSIGSIDTSVPPIGTATSASQILARAQGTLRSLGQYQVVYITSSLPYIEVLEFGGYPSPVKKGTWDKKLRRYVVKSEGGYSKQAPQGMVRLTFQALSEALR